MTWVDNLFFVKRDFGERKETEREENNWIAIKETGEELIFLLFN